MSTLIKEWGVGAMRRGVSGAPNVSRVAGTNFPWDTLVFGPDDNSSVYVFGTIPESGLYTAAQDIEVEFSWVSDASSTGVVMWLAYILGRVAGEAWDVAYSDAANGGSARTASNALHVLSIIFSAPTLEPGDDFILKLLRWAASADDTYPTDANLVRARMYAAG